MSDFMARIAAGGLTFEGVLLVYGLAMMASAVIRSNETRTDRTQ